MGLGAHICATISFRSQSPKVANRYRTDQFNGAHHFVEGLLTVPLLRFELSLARRLPRMESCVEPKLELGVRSGATSLP